MTYYSRKSPRIKEFDYSQENYIFVTICTHQRRCFLGNIRKTSWIGEIAKKHIEQMEAHYDGVKIDKYVIMPNHIHMILVLEKNNENNAVQIIGQYKSGVSRQVRKEYPDMILWQRSFHDHVIRSQADYERIWLYIEGNPQSWEKDCFYIDQSLLNH